MCDAIGWLGAVFVLVAYYLVSSNLVDPKSMRFQSMNILGALLLVYYTHSCKAYASMMVNIIWVFIGIHSLVKGIQINKTIDIHQFI